MAMMAKHQKSKNDRQHHNQRIAKSIVSIILDNKKNGKVGEELRKHLIKDSKLSVISGLFSIYGFESLKKELGRINDVRLILSRTPVKNNDSEALFPYLTGDRFELRFRNQLNQTKIAGECARWLADKAQIRTANNPRKRCLTRYTRLMNEIIRTGVKTKVLMLSATPVNNRMNDLKNQVAFITEATDDAYADYGIISIEQTLRKAQTLFNRWLRLEDRERKVEALLDSMNFDYFRLLDILTIARSRKHIEKYYDIAEIGEFPERLKPVNIKEDIDIQGEFPPLKEINRTIRKLNLSAYSPLKYVVR